VLKKVVLLLVFTHFGALWKICISTDVLKPSDYLNVYNKFS
jgi:hypothetical protein